MYIYISITYCYILGGDKGELKTWGETSNSFGELKGLK